MSGRNGTLACGLLAAAFGILTASADVVLETEAFRLTVGDDARAKSLVLRANGEELLDPTQEVALFATTQDRPFNNEIKLAHPNKRTTYPANRIRREGDRLVVGFEIAPYEAVVRVRAGKGFLGFTLEEWIAERGPVVYGQWLGIDKPPVSDFRLVQLPVKTRRNFGDWMNCTWDERAGVAVMAADPRTDADHEDRPRAKLLNADLHRGIRLLGGAAAIVAGAGPEPFLAGVEELENAYDLPRGVESRRSGLLNASIYWSGDVTPATVDEHIAFAKKGGFRMMLLYYPCFLKGGWGYDHLGDYDWRDDAYPNGEADVKAMLAKIRAAGITPGFHTLQTHVGLKSRYVAPACDPRLNLTRRFDLVKAIPAEGDVAEIFVAQNPVHAMRYPRGRVLRFGGELFGYADYTTEPPYRFTGVTRGLYGTRRVAHAYGEGGGTLDVSEFGGTSCYVDPDSDLQDEIAAKIARICDCGMGFCYFDGSEGAKAPCNVNVSLAQWRTCRKFRTPPLFTEGAAKSHFGWHLQAGANAFDIFRPEEFKRRILEFPFAEAPMMRQNFTRLDFGWWGMWNPDATTMGVQADLWEFGTSKAAAWDCPATIQVSLDVMRRHPRIGDILETMRRWEDVRARRWLTPAQKEALRDPKREFHLYLNGEGAYELVEITMIEGVADGEVRAFAFERNGRRMVALWHVRGEGALKLPKPLAGDAREVAVGNRRYVETGLSVPEIVAILKGAKLHVEAAPLVVARRGAAADVSVVVSAKALPCERYAADELTNFVFRMTGVHLPVVSDAAALPAKAVVLGATRHTPPEALPQKEPSGDAFRLSVKDGRLYIGGAKRGVLYGVYELLERFGGCRWYASWCEKVPARASFEIPDGFVDEQRPAFLMREPFWWDVNKNRDFAARIRVNGYNHTPNDVTAKLGGDDYRFGGGLPSCHTFNRLCDPEVYFDAHPEYFSMIKGKRQKDHTQLCLTNPDVLRIVTSNVLARIRSDPGAKFYGVSQNDWYNYCECPACKAVDDEEESHAGTMVRFVNAVAEGVEKEFPDAIIETLAYQYTRKPPKKTKLRHNVVPCLCTIECDFSRPLTESRYRENVDFLRDIVGWSAQTARLYVWDYVTNFRRYTMPHANFDALQGNVKCFRDNGVKYLFEQGDSLGRHADFAELKAWLLAKWMWNPDLPEEPLLRDFFDGYYGAAAPFVRTYFDELRAVQRQWSDDPTHPLRIYELSDYAALTDAFLERSAALLAKAAEAVRGDSVRAHNVRMCAFSVDCMRLDRMRKLVGYDLWIADEPFDVAVWKRGRELAQCVVKTLNEVPHIRLAESVSNADMNDAWRAMATNPPPSYVTGARAGVVGAARFEGNNPVCRKAVVPCAGTKDGKALAFFETPWDWCGRYYLYGCRLQPGVRYRLRVRAKVEKATEPIAFRAGVRINDLGDDKVDRLMREIPASETSPDWKWYDVGACIPGPDDFFFVGHAATATKNGRTDEQKILVDCLELSRVD